MKLTIFPSGPGDCLLLTGADGRRVLIDGGERYRSIVAPYLAGSNLDVVYVSHDDGDHIKGVLELFEDMKDWLVVDFQRQRGNPVAEELKRELVEGGRPRPPAVASIWHNAFHDLLPDDFRPVLEAVRESLGIVSAVPQEERQLRAGRGNRGPGAGEEERITVADVIADHDFFVNSQRQSHELSRLVGRDLLKLQVNPRTEGGLMRTDVLKSVGVGGMRFRLLGPRPRDIERLRELYRGFLLEATEVLEDIRRDTSASEELLRRGESGDVAGPLLEQAARLGRRSRVTPPNHASLMFCVEEGPPSEVRRVLLTGDGHHAAILESLREKGLIGDGDDAHLHVPVLKVPHHGSEHNVDEAFCRQVTADHYVFCGNGAHHNPDLEVVELFVRQRARHRRVPAEGNGPQFKLWFSAHETTANTEARKSHMRDVQAKVAELGRESELRGLFESRFLTANEVRAGDFPEITI